MYILAISRIFFLRFSFLCTFRNKLLRQGLSYVNSFSTLYQFSFSEKFSRRGLQSPFLKSSSNRIRFLKWRILQRRIKLHLPIAAAIKRLYPFLTPRNNEYTKRNVFAEIGNSHLKYKTDTLPLMHPIKEQKEYTPEECDSRRANKPRKNFAANP